MFEILLSLMFSKSDVSLLTFLSQPLVSQMDVNKTRDPRLARADPRLRTQSPQSTEGEPSAATGVEDSGSQSAAADENENFTSSYKARPLFCVVCASNQVRNIHYAFRMAQKG